MCGRRGARGRIRARFTKWPLIFWAMGIVLIFSASLGYFVITEGSWELNGKSLSVMVFIEALDALGGTMGVKVLILINFAWNQAGVVGLD